jgi:hypothetical protein
MPKTPVIHRIVPSTNDKLRRWPRCTFYLRGSLSSAFLQRFSMAPEAAALKSFWKLGLSAWLGAGQAIACRNPWLIALSRLISMSISSALATSICLSNGFR